MLYAVMNLGGWLPVRSCPPSGSNYGIKGAYWSYTATTIVGLGILFFMLSRKTVRGPSPTPRPSVPRMRKGEDGDRVGRPARRSDRSHGRVRFQNPALVQEPPTRRRQVRLLHLLPHPRETLFAYNWLVLPRYVNRAFAGTWVGTRFETATNLNSLLIFILAPHRGGTHHTREGLQHDDHWNGRHGRAPPSSSPSDPRSGACSHLSSS